VGAPPNELSPVAKQAIEKQMQVKLYMCVENNSKFVRGKKKVRENDGRRIKFPTGVSKNSLFLRSIIEV
jgi:hypothetical protein